MTQSKISDFFGRVGETSVTIDAVVSGEGRGTDNLGAMTCTPGGNGKKRQLEKQNWSNFIVATYNTGSLSELRTHQIVRELGNKRVSVALIQGMRNPVSGDRIINEYRLFYEGSGESAVDMHAGVIVAVRQDLLKNARVNKIPACSHRALLVRIKTRFVDVTFVAGYSPGDHLPRNLRTPFWKQLGEAVSRLPKRTTVIMGIDANGRVGRDGTGSVGEAGSERWTENGHSLHTFAERCQLTVLNTMSNCLNPGWTWRRSDGGGQGRIDYSLVSTDRTNMVNSNAGAVSWVELERRCTH